VNAKLHAEASSLRGQLDTANKLLAAPDKPALDNALHMALQVRPAYARQGRTSNTSNNRHTTCRGRWLCRKCKTASASNII
jgi:hypothetical protein